MGAAARTFRYVTADVFTDRQFGGNPLAVVLDARGMTDEEMLAVTREFNYSETTFVLPPERGGAARVRIFTPAAEIPFAGHPTVGTAHVLFATGALRTDAGETTVVLEEGVGDVRVRVVLGEGGSAELGGVEPAFVELSVARLPESHPAPAPALLAAALGLDPDELLGAEYEPSIGSCGLPFTLVAVRDRAAVARAHVRAEAWAAAFPVARSGLDPHDGARAFESEGVMVFALDGTDGADVHARVFVPELAVPEDPATGSACAALGGYLAARTPRTGELAWRVAQGVEMGRPSRLELRVEKDGGGVTGVRVGGSSVVVCEGVIRLRGDGRGA
ncbi:phenazine biosynthesis protein PhzF [Gemmatimonadetes bacterium T265]|nr:phenazine biosynthesis protein PhzF [Gemmatimonadetes bacterium T265]